MPYLEYVFCDKCGKGSNLDIDHAGTIEEYIKDKHKKDKFINSATLVYDYLVYHCSRCRSRYRYTYRDIELKVRKYFSQLSEEYAEYFRELDTRGSLEEQRLSGKMEHKSNIEDRLESIYKSNK